MAIEYDIFLNDGAGGPIDYGTAVASVSALTWTSSALTPGDWRFGVRARDTVTGLSESNVDAAVEVVIGGGYQDVSGVPPAPVGLAATPTKGGGARVTWSYPYQRSAARPTGFHVYAGTPSVSYATPVATVTAADLLHYSASIAGLSDGSTYQIAVRAYSTDLAGTHEEANDAVVTLLADSTPPDMVDYLTAS
ncbi:fibronectin type III domain-containing protein [Singulisphaera sp. PoT]|uniref:fibronectin type III domain-containing protein n=1 Tax=Singulisphaera sp. PoT TaxID=3411797 RepID=UPI003BF5930B